jgi:hypothetical protein
MQGMETHAEAQLGADVAAAGDAIQAAAQRAIDFLLDRPHAINRAGAMLVDVDHTAPELTGLRRIVARARKAITAGDEPQVWRVLDIEFDQVSNEWDRLRGRPYLTEADQEASRQHKAQLVRDLRESLRE